MYRKVVTLGALLISVFSMAACSAPDYVNEAPTTAEILPMSQVDTASKLNKICTNVITSSASIEQLLAKYTNSVAISTLDDKNAIISNALANIQTVKKNVEEINSFNPAAPLKQKTADIKLALNDNEAYLRSIKQAVENDDIGNINSAYISYMNNIGILKTLSTGV